MSLRTLLNPQTKLEEWSHIYANIVDADQIDAGSVVMDDLNVTNLTVSADCLIGPNNFNVIGGVGTDGQVLSTDGAGHVQWVTNGSGNVSGPVSSVSGDLCSFADSTGQLIEDSGINFNDVMTNNAQIECNDQFVNNVRGLILKDQSLISLQPLVNSHQLYAKLSDGKIYSQSNLGVSYPMAYENADVIFNNIDGQAGYLGIDHVGGGDSEIVFYDGGTPQKYIINSSNVLHVRNSAFADICTMNDSKNAEFFGDVKVDGNLIQSNVSNQTMPFTGTIDVATHFFFNAVGDPNNLGAGASSVATNQVVAVNSKIKVFSYNTTSGDGTSQVQIYKNDVGTGAFLLSGTSGTVSLDISCSAGDKLSIRQEAGTDIDLSIVSLHLVSA